MTRGNQTPGKPSSKAMWMEAEDGVPHVVPLAPNIDEVGPSTRSSANTGVPSESPKTFRCVFFDQHAPWSEKINPAAFRQHSLNVNTQGIPMPRCVVRMLGRGRVVRETFKRTAESRNAGNLYDLKLRPQHTSGYSASGIAILNASVQRGKRSHGCSQRSPSRNCAGFPRATTFPR